MCVGYDQVGGFNSVNGMRIAINGNRRQQGHFGNIDRLVTALLSRGDTVVMSDKLLNYLSENLGRRFPLGILEAPLAQPVKADLAISIGGDGAFLRTAHWVGDSGTPVAGINTGHLGYLAAFSFDRFDEIERVLLGGTYRVRPRAVMSVSFAGADSRQHTFFALNELAVTRSDMASMVSMAVSVGDNHPLTYLGDGLIVSTPTGSTAYNLSVGGPILDPDLPGWVISPIAAHSLAVRPMVVTDSAELRIHVTSRGRTFRLAIDGKAISVNESTTLVVRKAPYAIHLVEAPGHSFTDTLSTKLGLGK